MYTSPMCCIPSHLIDLYVERYAHGRSQTPIMYITLYATADGSYTQRQMRVNKNCIQAFSVRELTHRSE